MATLVLEHSDTARADRLGFLLRDHGHRMRLVRPHHGEAVPGSLNDIDAIVVMGGPAAPTDDTLPWMAPELDLLAAAHAAQMPILGICLGCQLLARALGGEVERLPAPEIGFAPITLSPVGREDPLFAGVPWVHAQFHAHAWQVSKLPAGARLLASSAVTRVQAWSMGLRTFAVQYHPECRRATIEAIVAEETQTIRAAGTTAQDILRDLDRHWADYERTTDRFFESVALCLMPLDRRFAGIARDVHH
ncbi:MAG: type 1 glutamine amidotransferase [Phycisphaeraceae bacterium]|nr:type 1 glutamine amidotransferase [Phycisphaeraceae bacterium]